MESIGRDAAERAAIIRRSLAGAVSSSLAESARALDGARARHRAFEQAADGVEQVVASRAREVAATSSDDVLRGEVSARIAEVLGSWDMTRTISRFVSGVSARVMGALRGEAAPDIQVQRDLTGGLAARLADQYQQAWADALRTARPVLGPNPALEPLLNADEASERARRTAQEWTAEVTQIIRSQAESSHVSGRLLAGGINVVTVSLMVERVCDDGGA